MEAVIQLILVDLPKNDKSINKSDKFLSIKKSLGPKEVDVEIQFLINFKPVFDDFMIKVQKEEPMIHLLYPSTEKLLKTLWLDYWRVVLTLEKMEEHLKTLTCRMLISFQPQSLR